MARRCINNGMGFLTESRMRRSVLKTRPAGQEEGEGEGERGRGGGGGGGGSQEQRGQGSKACCLDVDGGRGQLFGGSATTRKPLLIFNKTGGCSVLRASASAACVVCASSCT